MIGFRARLMGVNLHTAIYHPMPNRPNKANTPILDSQKNDVFRLVRDHGFDPGDFQWQVAASAARPGDTVDQLAHVASGDRGFAFAFEFNTNRLTPYDNDRISMFSPGPEHFRVVDYELGWEAQLRVVDVWLSNLRREVETVSLWDTFGREPMRELATADFSNSPLSKEQREAVEARVTQARGYLRANVEDRERLRRVEKKLDELLEASKHLGKKDFATFSLGVMMQIAVDAAFNPHQAQELVNLFFTGVRALLGH